MVIIKDVNNITWKLAKSDYVQFFNAYKKAMQPRHWWNRRSTMLTITGPGGDQIVFNASHITQFYNELADDGLRPEVVTIRAVDV